MSMFEILRVLVEAAIKLLNPEAIERFRREVKQRALGTSLFRLYIALMDLINKGEQLLMVLRRFTRRKRFIQASGTEAKLCNQDLMRIIDRQREMVEAFLAASGKLHEFLLVVDAEAASVIAAITIGKKNALDWILGELNRNRLPAAHVANDWTGFLSGPFDDDTLKILEESFCKESLPPLSEWCDEHYERAEVFIKAAEDELSQVRQIAAKFKISLEAYFSLKEVLPDLSPPDSHRFPSGEFALPAKVKKSFFPFCSLKHNVELLAPDGYSPILTRSDDGVLDLSRRNAERQPTPRPVCSQ